MNVQWRELIVDTIRAPEEAGRRIMAVPLSRLEIWLAVVAVAALNAVFSGLIDMLSPPPPPEFQQMPILSLSPMAQALLIGGMLVLLAHMLTWVGRVLGGSGQIDDMLKLMIWMQFVAMVLQAANMVVLFAIPMLGAIFVLVILLVLLRVLICFVKVGHGFNSLGQSALVLIAGFIGMVVGLSLLLLLIGAGNLGVQASV